MRVEGVGCRVQGVEFRVDRDRQNRMLEPTVVRWRALTASNRLARVQRWGVRVVRVEGRRCGVGSRV